MSARRSSRLVAALVMGAVATAAIAAEGDPLPAPQGLSPCAAGDPVAKAEARVAEKLGGAYLGCFQSRGVAPPGKPPSAGPSDHGFAMSIPGRDHDRADLDAMLTGVRQQWRDFTPLARELPSAYLDKLNALIAGSGLPGTPSVASVAPVLVGIDQDDDGAYYVTSIRTYVATSDGRQVRFTKVNADAVLLRRGELLRLTLQRPLSDPAEVAGLRRAIADWARAIAAAPTGR